MYLSIHKQTVTKRENPFDITDEELAKVKEMSLSDKSKAKLNERDEQIR